MLSSVIVKDESANLKIEAHFIFWPSVWTCEWKDAIFAAEHIVVKQQLTVHSSK